MTSPDLPTPISAPAPTVLQVLIALPDHIAEFGLSENVTLPPSLLEQMAAAPHPDDFARMVGDALQQQFARCAWSLATSLTAVLAQRARSGAPLGHEEYIVEQSRILEERRAAAAAALADAAEQERNPGAPEA